MSAIRDAVLMQMRDEVQAISRGLRRAVARAGGEVQGVLRGQARQAGFKDGGRAMANSWRLRVYPEPGITTLQPAAVIKSNMPEAVDAFERGAIVTVKNRKWLVWPTGFNALGGRVKAGFKGGVRITPEQMAALSKTGQTFVLRSKSNPAVSLWCIRVFEATGLKRGGKRGGGRLRLFAGNGVEVATGNVKGQQQRRRELLKQGFVPMFFMSRRVTLPKKLDVEGVRRQALDALFRHVVAELGA